MSLIASVRTFILTYQGLDDAAGLLTDVLTKEPVQYALVPLPGPRIVETYLTGANLREFQFALQSMESTADDAARMQASGFYEAFADWLEEQNENGNLPMLDAGKTANEIQPIGHGILFEFGESGTSIYQIQCRLTYEQNAR
jgi:hypothetical protein